MMHAILARLVENISFTDDIARDVTDFLQHYGCPNTAVHSAAVAAEARRLAAQVDVDETAAAQAAWLHDISAVFPADERVAAAEGLGIDVLPEERTLPMILHQKLSAVLAREVFGVTDAAVLSAIGCHTTLKVEASRLDKLIFVADKLAWDQPGEPPYRAAMIAALVESLDAAACVYLRYLWERRATLAVVHPWFAAAYRQLCHEASSASCSRKFAALAAKAY
ncbi:MAG TPA: bis(5'-nucleosyl)-tetraphosphatase (symmetrical) YqeK [Anaerolineae bacterium]|nr:bis(5'-nucleosyl)-tetraphosphatase (symmetrical) YqeK [Anaerolineae bacterium]HQI85296.1 bis(5'-nucleosyl)-tetraphosphatase (symmetrical) YqeK [Anaerolineae bacterium]